MGSAAEHETVWPFGAPERGWSRRPVRTAVAFGGGGARGWAHIGVLKAFRELGFRPDIVAGTSIGSIASVVQATDTLDAFLEVSEDFDWFKAAQLFVEFGIHRGGLAEGRKVIKFFESMFPVKNIEDLPIPFAAVATDLFTSEEIVFRSGPLTPALRASISIPGIFTPVYQDGRYLIDGGLVNPLPIDVVKDMGATHIVAVNLNGPLPWLAAEEAVRRAPGNFSDIFREFFQDLLPDVREHDDAPEAGDVSAISSSGIREKAAEGMSAVVDKLSGRRRKAFSENALDMNLFDVFTRSLRIAEDRITASCIQSNPPDVLIEPAVADISTMDFSRPTEAIEAGYVATMRVCDTKKR